MAQEGTYECKGCGRLETEMARDAYKGPLYKDTINDELYCIRCSRSFYEMKNLPDGVVREDETFKKPTGLDWGDEEYYFAPDAD